MEPIWQVKPALNPDFAWEPMPDGCLVYRTESGQVLTLNPAAELILSYCDGTATVRGIFDEISAEIPMPEAEFLAAISQFLKENAVVVA